MGSSLYKTNIISKLNGALFVKHLHVICFLLSDKCRKTTGTGTSISIESTNAQIIQDFARIVKLQVQVMSWSGYRSRFQSTTDSKLKF